jgi:hypothetical protein
MSNTALLSAYVQANIRPMHYLEHMKKNPIQSSITYGKKYISLSIVIIKFLDFRLSPCFKCRVFFGGCSPVYGV